ncbi:MAG: tetratricopeptide repeat protein [Bacteroidota bacterium]|nr:tetratricopeptide repeat protein [Bacteroidota bacterium]
MKNSIMYKTKNRIFKIIFILLSLLAFTGIYAQSNSDDELAAQYYQNKEFDKAVVLYEKMYSVNPLSVYSTYLNCLIELKDYGRAEKVIRKQMKLNPQSLAYNVDLGYVFSFTREKDKAKKEYEKAIKNISQDKDIIIDLANAFLNRKEIDYAIETYLKGKAAMSGTYGFNYELSEIYERKGDFEKMYNEYLGLLESNYGNQTVLQNALQTTFDNDPENKKQDILKNILLQKIQKNPDVLSYSELLIWLVIQQKDFDQAYIQNKAIDRRMGEDGSRLYNLARICISNNSYDVAAKCYQYVIDKGPRNAYYYNSKMELISSLYQKISSQVSYTQDELNDLNNKYIATINELGKTANAVEMIKEYAHYQAFYMKNIDIADSILNDILDMPGVPLKTQCEAKLELGDILLIKGEVWEATLLYSQVEKSLKEDPIGHMAKFKNAKLSYYIGEFGWAQQQLDVLKAATSKLIANDAMELSMFISDNTDPDSSTTALALYSKADFLSFQNRDDEALVVLDSIAPLYKDLLYSLYDDVLMKKAKIYIGRKQFEIADSMLATIVKDRGEDILADDALYMRAELYKNQFNNKQKAMEFYQEIITKYPGSLYVVEARREFRRLRGDIVN